MRKRSLPLFVALISVSFGLLTYCTSGEDNTTSTYNTASSSPDSLCIVQPSWFPHTQTPAPAEGIGSPFDTSSTTNQIFHQWSWNKFLWLTKPDLNGKPLFLNKTKVLQINAYMDTITGSQLVLQDTAQAGSGNPELHTNPDYNSNSSSIVYYSIHMNPTMYTAATTFGRKIIHDSISQNNNQTFPVGSFELKVSWVPVSAIPQNKRSLFFTTQATIYSNGGATSTVKEVALLGMHVVGVVQNHPEFIWATFEHDELSPDYDWVNNSASSDSDMLIFRKGSVSGIGGIQYNTSTRLGQTPYSVFDLFKYGIPVDSTGAFLSTSQQEPINYNNIDGINQCVKSQLDDVWKNYFYNGSIWLNMDGTTASQQSQIIDSLGLLGATASATPGSLARGSMNCANVTMESFTQTFEGSISTINAGNLVNCFVCHNSSTFEAGSIKGNSPLYLSHAFQGYLQQLSGKTPSQIEAIKARSEAILTNRLRLK